MRPQDAIDRGIKMPWDRLYMRLPEPLRTSTTESCSGNKCDRCSQRPISGAAQTARVRMASPNRHDESSVSLPCDTSGPESRPTTWS